MTKKKHSGFSYENYKNLLETLKTSGYSFSFFSDANAQSRIRENKPVAFLRHDVDRDLPAALEMARREESLNVQATFFLLVRTDLYNVFSRTNTDIVNEIRKLGHRIGLHFDCASYPETLNRHSLGTYLQTEVSVLEKWFETDIPSISFHRPEDWILEDDDYMPDGFVNTYNDQFIDDITYRSDSRGHWGHGHPLESRAFKNRHPMQLLVHPPWWNETEVDPQTTFNNFIDQKQNELRDRLSENYSIFNPEQSQ